MGSPSSGRGSSYRKPSVVTWLAYVGMTVLAVWIPVRDGLDVAPGVLTALAAVLVGATFVVASLGGRTRSNEQVP